MDHPDVAHFVRSPPRLPGGVLAVVLCESALHLQATAAHLVRQGASAIIAIGRASAALSDPGVPVIRIAEDPRDSNAPEIMSALMRPLHGRWLVWLWNGEFLFFPFCETRAFSDLAEFLDSERRHMVYTYAFDLYADPLPTAEDSPRECDLYFDRLGYYAFPDQDQTLKIFGSIGWRFEEITPTWMRQIGRASLVRASKGLTMRPDLQFADPDYASASCPWHRNPTAAMMSLRRTRRICTHPRFVEKRQSLMWHGSTRFDWSSRQLLDLGMIEPGQWF